MHRLTGCLSLVLTVLALGAIALPLQAQLFENLRALGGTRYSVGDPSLVVTNQLGDLVSGPKDVVVADLDGDGHPDLISSDKNGGVTVRYGVGDGTFDAPVYLWTTQTAPLDGGSYGYTTYYTNVFCNYQIIGAEQVCITNDPSTLPSAGAPPPPSLFCYTNFQYGCVGSLTNVYTNNYVVSGPFGLRGVAVADLTGDGRKDIAVASPGEQRIYLFVNQGGRVFTTPSILPAWFGVRDLAVGDFDGDGLMDLAAAGSTNGVVQYHALGAGRFAVVATLVELASDPFDPRESNDFPQPAYYLKAFRPPGATKDTLVASFAKAGKIWVFEADVNGRLVKRGDIEGVGLTGLDAAPLLSPATNGAPVDLLTSWSRGGLMQIFASTNLPQRFTGRPQQSYYIPGSPRNVRIVDLDLDGWNDIVVVAQGYNKVMTYHNDHGTFSLVAEAVTGMFPREMDLGDFNGDGRPDLAVLNRLSSDVSIFLTATNFNSPAGFMSLDSEYPVDGGVSGLELRDINRDGRLDVVQLHRSSSEFSVRLTAPDGRLGEPTFYPITNAVYPTAQSSTDVNNDGITDMVTANLSGSVTVRLGLAGGGFGPEHTFSLPSDQGGSLFALVPGDFDRDGNVDLAAGYFDCRVSFFRGDGKGGFTFTHTHQFIYEPRSMFAVDVDQDGDLDLVGGSWMDQFVVVENEGDLLTTPTLKKTLYGGYSKSGYNLKVLDQNGDGDPDLIFGSPDGFSLWLGGSGTTFTKQPTTSDPSVAGATFVTVDLDGDGDSDIAAICATNACLSIQTYTNGQFVTVFNVPVPPTRYLAAGDLDGDGFMDLVGSGDVLWVALSSRRASNAPPAELLARRSGGGGVVINEVLAQNQSVAIVADGERFSDFVELYNNTSQAVPLAGWRLMLVENVPDIRNVGGVLVTNQAVVTNNFVLPNDAPLAPRSHRVVVCSDRLRTIYHSGFNLPAEGGLLCLFDSRSNEVDRVNYQAQSPDIAYARYADGARSFVMNTVPSPGSPNVDNGAVNPVLSLSGVDFDSLRGGSQPIRFRATARDDLGIINVSVLWRRLDILDTETKRLVLFDDGINEDGPANDGRYLGVLRNTLPPGAEIQFYLECTDLSDQVVTSPGNPLFGRPGVRPQLHTLAVGVPRSPLEISEIVADNLSGLVDEVGRTPDWVEIRNTSSNTVSLAGVGIAPRLFGDSERMGFTNRPSIGPGEHLVIYADGKPAQGSLHAPFRLNRDGAEVVLSGTTPNGARYVIDSVNYGPQATDRAFSRLGARGPWTAAAPTPRLPNVLTPWRTLIQSNIFTLAFPTQPGRTYAVEYTSALTPSATWQPLPDVRSVGLEMNVQDLIGSKRFFRVRQK